MLSARFRQVVVLLSAVLFGCGSPARDGSAGPPGPPPQGGTWTDQVEGRKWTVSNAVVLWQDALEACDGTFTLPTVNQLKLARARGICGAIQGDCPVVWAPEITTTQALTFNLKTGESSVEFKTTFTAATECVQRW